MALPTLYLLPGLLCDASIWSHQIEALRPACEVRVADFTLHDSIGDMAESVLAQAPARFAVAGHSMGARVALEVWRRAPARVERIALLDTGVHPVRPGEREQRQVLVDLAFADGMGALADRWLPPMVAERRLGDEALMAPLRQMVMSKTPQIYARQIQALLGRPDATGLLGEIDCSVLIGVGSEDRWSPPAQHEAMVAATPAADYVVFEGAGHMAPVETPEAVSQALLRWMARGER